MNRARIDEFAELTRRQLHGDPSALSRLAMMNPTLSDGYCLYNAYEQWKAAFSFHPGRTEALPVIARLAEKITGYTTDDPLLMYAEPEWKIIVDQRGPFDCAIRYTCGQCNTNYVGFGQSGFDDRCPAVCDSCGNVWLQSGYDDAPLPECECGGVYYHSGCPRCRSHNVSAKSYFSSFEYFMDHKWKEKGPSG
jgi:hypothetical protein